MKLHINSANEQDFLVIDDITGSIVLEQPLFTQIFYRVQGDRRTRVISCGQDDKYQFLGGEPVNV